MDQNLPPETELEEAPEVFEKELDDVQNNRATSWDKEKQRRFLLKMCIKELPAETDTKQILNTFLGKKKFKGKSVINNPSYVYDIDEESGQRPANLACKYGNSQVLEFLLDELKVCPARKNKFGDTALHSIILGAYTGQCNVQNALECTKLVTRNVRVLDILDRSNKTALCLAMSYNIPEIAKELVEAGAFVRYHLRPQVLLLGLQKVDEVECPHLPILSDMKDSLDSNDEQSLEKTLRDYEIRSLNDGSSGFDTNLKNRINLIIRTAIENNMPGAIKLLLNCGTDINICFMNGTTLLHQAIELQRLDCIKILLEYDNCNVNARIQNNNESLLQCRAMIRPRERIKKRIVRSNVIPIKETQNNFVSGDSALHLALKSGQTKVVKWLVGKDVDLFQANMHGYKPISLMTTKELRTYFDYRVRRGTDTDNIVTFDFNCLLLKENENNRYTELEVLKTIASLEKHRSVLNHPLIRCFLYLKMTHVYWLYYLNFIFYALFTFFLTCLVLPDNNHWVPILVHYVFVAIFTAILFAREVLQITLGPATYFKLENLFENLLEILIILSSTCILIIFCFHSHGPLWKVVTSLGILFSYVEFMLMIGRHPRLATYITMFFRVSGSTLYFTIWYTPLIVAFSFIFFIFLHDTVETFQSIWGTVFKSIIMLTGEFEADDIWSTKNNITDNNTNGDVFDATIHRGRVFFIFFIFFIAIVLVNLLNALAISDTNAVKDDAEILSYVSQIKYLYRIEVALSRKWVMNFGLSRKLLRQFRLLTISSENEEIKMAKEKVRTENGMYVNDVPLMPNDEIIYFNIDTFEKCTNVDYAIQKRLVFNKVQKLLFVQLLTHTSIKKINWLQRVWTRLKFLPPFEEILEDSLDLIHRNTNDSIEDRIKNLNIEDIHLKLKNIEKILLQLKYIEHKVDASDIKMNEMESKLDSLDRKISNV